MARTLSDGLSSQLASLRQIVVEAEERRERDSTEIARLTAELSDRNTLLAERSTKIQSMKQSLRELADSFD